MACTITTRVNASNQHYVIEKDMSEIKYIGKMSSSQNRRVIDPEGISYAVTNGEKDGEPKIIEPNVLSPKRTEFGKKIRKKYESGEVELSRHEMTQLEPREDGVSNTITSVQKDNLLAEPLRIPQATKQGFVEVMPGSLFDMSYPESKTRRGRVQEGGKISPTLMDSGDAICYYEGTAKTMCLNSKVNGKQPSLEHRIYDSEGISTAMTTRFHPNIQEPTFRIRKLTTRECFRLMGVSESDIDKIQQSGVSQSQQYKMAGNSIVVDVLEHIFRKMFVDTNQESQQLSLF